MRNLLLSILLCVVSCTTAYAQGPMVVRDPVTNVFVSPGSSPRGSMLVANPVQEAIDINISNFLTNISSAVISAGAAPTIIGQKGIVILMPRNDAGTTLCDTTGKFCPPQLGATGGVRMEVANGNADLAENAVLGGTWTGPGVQTLRDDALSTGASGGDGRPSAMRSNAAGAVYVNPASDNPAGGLESTSVISTESTNAVRAKATGGNLYGVLLVNPTVTKAYIRFYNLTTNPPPCNSSSGWKFSLEIPPSDAGINPYWDAGIAFPTGLGWCITGGSAGDDNTNAGAGIVGVVVWK